MSKRLRLAFFGVLAFQLLFLLGLVTFKEVTLRFGQTVILQTVPVDPRSMLQGDFVILQYKIATLPAHLQTRKLAKGTVVYVVLRKGQEVWEAEGYDLFQPGLGEVFIKGRVDGSGRLDFGLGTYFVPEGTGRIIERASDIKVKATINSQGSAVIKEILVDGEPFSPGSE